MNRQRIILVAAASVTTVAVAAFAIRHFAQPSAAQLALASRLALNRGDVAESRRLAALALARAPGSPAALLAAAEVEHEEGRDEESLAFLLRIPADGSSEALAGIGAAGDMLIGLKRTSDAVAQFQRILKVDPYNFVAHRRLAVMLALAGQRAALAHYLEVVKGGKFDTHELALLGDPEQVYENETLLTSFEEPLPDDPLVLLGAARYALHFHELTKAGKILTRLATRQPDDVAVQVNLGRVLIESESPDEFREWHAGLPIAADEHPETWTLRGRYAQKLGETGPAIRCYAEAVRRDPNQWQSNNQLALLLNQRGDVTNSQVFRQRADQLKALVDTLRLIHVDSKRPALLLKAAELTESLGRPWEARGWYQAARDLQPDLASATEKIERLSRLLDDGTPQTLAESNPTVNFDLAGYPLPAWKTTPVSVGSTSVAARLQTGRNVTFVEEAQAVGINFTYHNGDDPEVPGMFIFESSGGGVAVIDFDGDAWPDLYFTQACDWPPRPGQIDYLDRLFRNLGNGHFQDVTLESGLGDERFSQGATVGDFDDDGFPDLYVGNIGDNRLYRNNGDGTFSDWTERAGLKGGGWTTSCLIADLNGDGFPEVFDVTYVAGRRPFEQVCHDKRVNDAPRICSPEVFDADEDRLFLNRGDGTFEDISIASGIAGGPHSPNGKGLGIAAADFDGSGRLSLYVANDTTANFLFLNQTSGPGSPPRFLENAILAGCALDSDGRGQASMGIAVDDANGDGLADLYITNFYNEYNILYLQQPGGTFIDGSSEARLKEPSIKVLGFGTQFLDADLDGWPDLVVANGNVDDFRETGIPFRMRGQYYANQGHGRFIEMPAEQLGNWFQTELLGRGMARLDWNRDGHEDFAVSNLDTPASLVTNTTTGSGHFLALQFRGVTSSRDAIGVKATVTARGRTRVRQLTAGDGYESSNQRQLVFGLGDSTAIDKLVIDWPSGLSQEFTNVVADSEWLLIESRADLVHIPQ